MRRGYVVPMRWMVIFKYGVPGGALNLNSTNYPDHGHHEDSPLSGKNPRGRAGNRTWYLMISSQKRWPLDREASLTLQVNADKYSLLKRVPNPQFQRSSPQVQAVTAFRQPTNISYNMNYKPWNSPQIMDHSFKAAASRFNILCTWRGPFRAPSATRQQKSHVYGRWHNEYSHEATTRHHLSPFKPAPTTSWQAYTQLGVAVSQQALF
jgi:hypothetical protein